ncbi:MAG: glycosyltransferase family 2 protein [Candidatus Methanoperedens sp.]|nr:glycosyltransferase family 2 protein [Candidatus Methanoperedens sp.]MCZ7405180.1 glycosyltransferase family 2 protein [Candidatus Methanoperedens sp.]
MNTGMLSVVIPAYNEQENIPHLVKSLEPVMEKLSREYEIVFIDDGSTDNTFDALKEARKNNSRIKIIKFRKNFGQTAALAAGFAHAKGDVIITMDSDLQNDPGDIPKLIEKLNENYDVVCGWRAERKDSIFKKLFSKFANGLRRKITGENIHDSGCTLRAYKKEAVVDLDLYGEMHRYIPALLSWKGYKIGEVIVQHHARRFGKTKYSWQRIIKGFLDLLVVTFWQRYSARPIHIFGSFGIILTLLGMIIGGYLGFERLVLKISLADRPLFILSILMVVIGIQFFMSGILADIMVKVYHGQNGKRSYLIERIEE